MKTRWAVLLAFCLMSAPLAKNARADDTLEQRVARVSSELRCLVCQNESLSSSSADLAADLRRQIREQMADGKSDAQIVDFMTDRYGDFIRYRPRLARDTLLLWFGPALLLLGALIGLSAHLRRHARPALDAKETPPESPPARNDPPQPWPRGMKLGLAALVPTASLILYLCLGRPEIPRLQFAAEAKTTELDALQTQANAAPNDAALWIELARAYRERHIETRPLQASNALLLKSAEAFARAVRLNENDPALLTEYALTLLLKNDMRYDATIDGLLEKALSLDARHPIALYFSGESAAERGDAPLAVERWERLLPQLDASSEEAAALKKRIGQARERALPATSKRPETRHPDR